MPFLPPPFFYMPLYIRYRPLPHALPLKANLEIESLLDLSYGLIGVLHGVADSPWVLVNLVIITTLEGLVAEEVDGGVVDAAGLLGLVLEVLEAVPLVPALGEDVEGDLATNGETSPTVISIPRPKQQTGPKKGRKQHTSSPNDRTSPSASPQTPCAPDAPCRTPQTRSARHCWHSCQWGTR